MSPLCLFFRFDSRSKIIIFAWDKSVFGDFVNIDVFPKWFRIISLVSPKRNAILS